MERLRKEKFTSFERKFAITFLASLAVIVAAAVAAPSQAMAASGTILDNKTNNSSNDVLGRDTAPTGYNDSIEYLHPTGSGDYVISAFVTTFQRSGIPAAGAKLAVYVYQGGSNPLSTTGALVASGSILATAVPNSGSPNDVQIVLNKTFTLTHGTRYYFLVGETDDSKSVFVYQFTSSNNGTKPFYTNKPSGWVHRPSTLARLKLFGEAAPPPSSATLTALTLSPYTVGQNIVFKGTWSNLTFTPTYFHFYEDVNDNADISTAIPIITTGTGSGNFSFYHAYLIASGTEAYTPYLDISDCGSQTYLTDSGCHHQSAVGSAISILTGQSTLSNDQKYPSELAVNGSVFKSGDEATFTYTYSGSICAGGVSGARLFLGFPLSMSQSDSGSILSATTGTIHRTYVTPSSTIGQSYFPHIHLYCSSGLSYDLYVGNTWKQSKAVPVDVVTATEYKNLIKFSATGYLNGSGSGGYLFGADSYQYQLYEPVKLHWAFFPAATVTKVRLYKDSVKLPADYQDFTAAEDIDKTTNHYIDITYSAAGEYYPSVVLYSGATIVKTMYINGGSSPDPLHPIYVENTVYSPTSFEPTTVLYGSGGIFAYLAALQIRPSPEMSVPLQALVVLANTAISTTSSVAQFGYRQLLQSSFFAWWADTIAPIGGTHRTAPAMIGTFNIGQYLGTRDYTITYATSSDAAKITEFFNMSLAFMILFVLIKKFFSQL